ncbi:PREDICTED: protocadherin alpha-C1-like [Charadrius vociferus]|uniref:protocadherin alpha-C1-like n=1 Tax=Charadrius vociferus TaxID=50402 RepID=UPI0005212A5C|nr:PREDICTED: protocadherin alpha-C1-like [Charadrius vociferus]
MTAMGVCGPPRQCWGAVLRVLVVQAAWALVVGQVRYSVAEEGKAGTVVGRLAQDLGLEAGEAEWRGLRLVSAGRRASVEVSGASGALVVSSRLDREELCGKSAPCALRLEVLVERPLRVFHVELEVTDINDNAPLFRVNEEAFSIAESLLPGSRFPLEGASDADIGSNAQLSYTLSPSEHFSLNHQGNDDQTASLALVLTKPLDRETMPVHRLVLTASDGGRPSLSGTMEVLISVLDANDNAPQFNQSVYKVKVLEGSEPGSLLITLSATDLDEGINSDITYLFSRHVTEEVKEMFTIDQKKGEIRLQGKLDYEEMDSYEIIVEARDKGSPPFSGHCKVVLEVLDVNDNAPEITITSLSSPVPEDAVPGTVIALLSIMDKDPGENGKVTCQIPDNLPFQLKPSLESYYSLVTSGLLDRELISGYNITITATDLGSPPITTQKTLWVQISDVNDNAPVFSADTFDVFVEENNPLGAFLYQVSASDADMGENGRVSYMLRNSTVAGSALASLLSVSLANGSIYAKRAFDFEQLRSFYFQVEAKDNGSPALSAAITVNVYISDQNDNAPAILYPTSQNGSIAVEVVPRLADEGYLVTKIVADDEDNAQNAWLSYHLTQSSDSNLFHLASHSGELRTTRSMRSTDFLKHKVVVVVQDHGDPPLSSTVTVGILLADTLPQALPDFDDSGEPPPLLNTTNIYLIVSLACVSCIFAAFLLFLAIVRLCRCQTCCCCSCCCPADEYTKYCYSVHMLPSSHLPPDMLEVTGVGKLTHTYLYRASVGLGPSNDSVPNGDAGNVPSGSRLQVPGPCIQVQQVQSDRLSAVLVASTLW